MYRLQANAFRSRLTRNAVGAFCLRAAGIGFSFLSSLFLARLLGAREYGAYAVALSVAGLLGVPALMGLDKLLMRESAIYVARAEWGLLRGLMRRASQAVMLLTAALALVVGGLIWGTNQDTGMPRSWTLWLTLGLLPVLTLTRLRQAVLRGLHQAARAQLPETVTQPVLFMLLLFCLWRLGDTVPTAAAALALYLIASVAALLHGAILLRQAVPPAVRASPRVYQTDRWWRSAVPLMVLGCVQAFNTQIDILLVGILLTPEQTGQYAAALKGAALVVIVAEVANTVLAPVAASLYATGAHARLRRLVTRGTRIVCLLSLPVALFLAVFGELVLALFGAEFVAGATALSILSIGHALCMAMGSVGLLLTMTGHERDTAGAFVLSALLNAVLILLLASRWGINGVAFGKSLSTLALYLFLMRRVRKRLGFYATVFG
jgi:O-antigen/teichoic acid export membrane protein